jgi:hypothetical protein
MQIGYSTFDERLPAFIELNFESSSMGEKVPEGPRGLDVIMTLRRREARVTKIS